MPQEPDPSPTVSATLASLSTLSERYARGADRRDREVFVSVFDPDATLQVWNPTDTSEPGRLLRGHEELGRIPERLSVYERTYHLLGQSSFQIDGADAVGEVHCLAHHLRVATETTDLVMFIRYHDRYRRGADGLWHIAARRVLVDWTETRPADPPGG